MPPQELWIFLARCRVSCSNFVLNAMYRYSISREDFHACVNHLLDRRARKAFYAVHLKRGIFQVIALLIIFMFAGIFKQIMRNQDGLKLGFLQVM